VPTCIVSLRIQMGGNAIRQCHPSVSYVSAIRQCQPSVPTVSAIRQCQPSVPSVSAICQCQNCSPCTSGSILYALVMTQRIILTQYIIAFPNVSVICQNKITLFVQVLVVASVRFHAVPHFSPLFCGGSASNFSLYGA
jgi:hypothetical protein